MNDLYDRELRAHAAGGYSSPGAIFPYTAGFKGSAETGREAAEAINKKLGRLQRLVLGAVKGRGRYGLTPEEGADILDIDRVSVQPRFSELKALGLVKDSGQRRVNPSSRKRAVVWVLAGFAPDKGGDL
ncbi:hypothetical protein J2W40_002200 [Sphingobium xenophagum]|uniref:HTH marR-type domain-containing protein n=1 Tax=Sphingobium xenophagum TaxID=121428 RepID=A0ABU1X1D5_SPHXE|nr:hypothetical protein [Sphingobium xenophagum]MDR7155373.1 hypothetical protein [Sphingobium xenophagum]